VAARKRSHTRTDSASSAKSKARRNPGPLEGTGSSPKPGFQYFPSPESSSDEEIIAYEYLYLAAAVEEWPGFRRWLEETKTKSPAECEQIELRAISIFREVLDAMTRAMDHDDPAAMPTPSLLDRLVHAHALLAIHAEPASLTEYRKTIYPDMDTHPEYVRPEHADFVRALQDGKWLSSGARMPAEVTRAETRRKWRERMNESGRNYMKKADTANGDSSVHASGAPIVLKVNPDQPDQSISGRVCFIQAVSIYCPGFWENLRDDVLLTNSDFFALRASGRVVPDETLAAAQACLDRWLWDWSIEDEWLMDSCRHTLDAWAAQCHHDGPESLDNVYPLPVWYGPNEPILSAALSEFTPVFTLPYFLPKKELPAEDRQALLDGPPTSLRIYEATVERESPAEFRQRMRAQFEAQLGNYTSARESQILLERGTQRRDAAWTALFHFGMTPKQLEAWEFERSRETFSQARIQQVVKAFALAIGLTIRPPKAGRAAKRKGSAIRG
jgi:hypothetical protein